MLIIAVIQVPDADEGKLFAQTLDLAEQGSQFAVFTANGEFDRLRSIVSQYAATTVAVTRPTT